MKKSYKNYRESPKEDFIHWNNEHCRYYIDQNKRIHHTRIRPAALHLVDYFAFVMITEDGETKLKTAKHSVEWTTDCLSKHQSKQKQRIVNDSKDKTKTKRNHSAKRRREKKTGKQ